MSDSTSGFPGSTDPTSAPGDPTPPDAPRETTDGPEPRVVVVTPQGMGIAEPLEDGEPGPADMVSQPAKVMRIGSMIKQLLEEVRSAPLDEAGRSRLATIHERSITELEDGLREVGRLRLYVPVVPRAEFDSAISYLVRRLEENAAPENFMSGAANLGSDASFLEALKGQPEARVHVRPR